MANYSVWNVRLRHQWLATPLKKKRIKRRSALRVGLLDAWERNKKAEPEEAVEEVEATEEATPTEE